MYRGAYIGIGILIVSILFWSLIGIAAYILTALGLYKIAQKRNMENAWIAWIPIGQFYIIGKIVGDVKFGTAFTVPRLDLILPLAPVAIWIVALIPFIGPVIATLASIAYAVLLIYSFYLLYKQYVPDQAVLYTVLSAIGLFAIFIFIIRDKEPVASE